MPEDPYAVLGLSGDASPQHVAEAYRALAQIYHPDRYADAPPRVKEEALRRMQAVNAAYDALRQRESASPPPAPPRAREPRQSPPPRQAAPPPPRQRQRADAMTAVLYVDGSPRYHHAAVAPLGLDVKADPVRTAAGAKHCGPLDEELSGWFASQSRNASMIDKLMYAAWDDEQRALYTATVGCSEVLLSSVRQFASPCPECRPGFAE